MMPSAPIAHCLRAPPVNKLYMPTTEPEKSPPCWSNQRRSAPPSNPGTGTHAITRQIPRTRRVKMILDLSSGILKQFEKVLKILRNMYSLGGPSYAVLDFEATSQEPPLASIFCFADSLKALAITVYFFLSSPEPRIFTPALLPFAKPTVR